MTYQSVNVEGLEAYNCSAGSLAISLHLPRYTASALRLTLQFYGAARSLSDSHYFDHSSG